MKRNTTVAAIAAAVLVAGGYTAFATGGHDGGRDDAHGSVSATAGPGATPGNDAGSRGITASRAAAAAVAHTPGTVTRIEPDDRHRGYWEVYVTSADGVVHELHVDAVTGRVTEDDRPRGRTRTGDASPTASPAPSTTRPGYDDRGGDRVRGDDRFGDDHGGDRAGSDDPPGDDHGGDRVRGDDRSGDDHGGHGRGRGRGGDDH
ncbi:PepSY domain-containing protein [Actinacidiphila glaucinigra]|uniref:PepSY domain-containing protein n=1 Tax=Actinacidiphila glaucinigra TaxID=235986 RepID=UPI0033A10C48